MFHNCIYKSNKKESTRRPLNSGGCGSADNTDSKKDNVNTHIYKWQKVVPMLCTDIINMKTTQPILYFHYFG